MLFDEIFDYMLYEHVKIVYFDDLVIKCFFYVENILECCELWIEWYILMWIMKCVWNWCHTFGTMYELWYVDTLSMKSLCFNTYNLAW